MSLAYSLVGLTAGAKNERKHPNKRAVFWPASALCIITHCLTIAMLASLQAQKQVSSTIFRHSWYTFLYISWALVTASVVCQTVYLVMLHSRVSSSTRAMVDEDTSNLSPYMDKEPRSMILQTVSVTASPHESLPSSTTVHDESALKHSVQQLLPTSSSQTRLVQSSMYSNSTTSPLNQSRRNSVDSGISTMSSARSLGIRYDAYSPRPCTPPQQRRLEPIPGSASNSPGRALEMAEDGPPPISRGRRDSSSSLDSITDQSRVPPRFRKYSTNQRPCSPVVISEALIHPLFRSDNPLPPPTPTFSTKVTASAFGGRTLSKEDLTRAQSRSRPSSPAHHPSSVNPSRQNSQSRNSPRVDLDTGSPIEQRARSLDESRVGVALQTAGDEGPPLPSGGLLPSTFDR